MKLLFILLSIILCANTLAQALPVKKPTIYYYQDPNILHERIGTNEIIDAKIIELDQTFIKNIAAIPRQQPRTPIDLVIIFNAKGQKKVWVNSGDPVNKKAWNAAAQKTLKEVELKALKGVTGLALHYKGSTETTLKTNPPIPVEWDSVINAKKQITTSELFEILLAAPN
jgi:hypothetical protein